VSLAADDWGLQLADICEAAAAIVIPYWRADPVVRRKADDSPVTIADQAAEAVILHALGRRFPGIPVIAEEDAAAFGAPGAVGRRFFLVDPLDGTKAFVRGDEHFTVNIALIQDRRPVAGAVAWPVGRRTWFTAPGGSFRRAFGERRAEPVHVRPRPARGGVALVSHSLGRAQAAALAARYGCDHATPMDSSIKLCRLAEGAADLYPRDGPTMEWDIAAGHAVLDAAGGRIEQPDGAPFLYGKAAQGFRNGGFVARGG
jgi:3'(2'), 5'-bisphosphate nucleotidase